jgi:Lantibiotic dehydratase, N terminus
VSGGRPQPPLLLLRVAGLPFAALGALAAAETARARCQELFATEDELAATAARLGEELYRAAGPGAAEDGTAAPGTVEAGAAGARTAEGGAQRRRRAIIALRRDLHNGRRLEPEAIAAAGGWLAPETARALAACERRRGELGAAEAACREALAADAARQRAALIELARGERFREGLRLASRSLFERLEELAAAGERGGWRHDLRHAAAKLAAYAGRFAAKTSPHSVFCSTALAAWSGGGGESAAVEGHNRTVRADYLLNVAEARKVTACLGAAREAWPAVAVRANPTLRRRDSEWSFWRPASPRRESDEEVLCRVRDQPLLAVFVDQAAGVRRGVAGLLAAVGKRCGHPPEEAAELAEFFGRLVEAGLLIAEVEPPYGCRRPLAFLARELRAAGVGSVAAAGGAAGTAEIEAVEAAVEALAGLPAAARPAAMDRIEARVVALPRARPLRGDELLRVDTASGLAVRLPRRVLDDLAGPLAAYARLFAALYPEELLRAGWAAPFLARFPPDREVELLDLYDHQHELFGAPPPPAVAGFPPVPRVAAAAELSAAAAAAWERAAALLAGKARRAEAAGRDEVELDAADWREMAGATGEPRWSAGVLFQVAAADPAAVGAGRYRLVLNALYSGAGMALARLAHLHGGGEDGRGRNPVVREIVRTWAPLRRRGALWAELTYNHLGRGANAGLRPRIFRHEIELPGDRASPGAVVIPLRELTVRWDRGAGRFVLTWAARGVEVAPVINSGISPEGFVSFLVEIGRQGMQPLSYFPGFDLPGVRRWPRFTCGRVVLWRRRWALAEGDLPPRLAGRASGGEGAEAAAAEAWLEVARWRRCLGLPRHVFAHTAADPKPFYVDLEAPLSLEPLRRSLAGRQGAGGAAVLHLVEMLPGSGEMWVRDARGSYAAEFLVSLRHLRRR